MNLYLPAAPASIVSLITRGNQGMFARMAELLEPARHETAILFADIQASSALSRRLSTQRWFELIRAFSTFADHVVVENTGIVGRHAGDGLASFFLAEQVGSRAAACAAALHAAREIVELVPRRARPTASCTSTPACTGAARSTSARWSPAGGSR